MSPARDHRASAESWPTPHKAPKTPWPRLVPTSNAPTGRWVDRALCAGRWAEFDPVGPTESRSALRARVAAARRICDRCPVAAECDTYARTARPAVTGIYAGRYRPINSTSREGNPTA